MRIALVLFLFCCSLHKNYYNYSAKLDKRNAVRYNRFTTNIYGGDFYVYNS